MKKNVAIKRLYRMADKLSNELYEAYVGWIEDTYFEPCKNTALSVMKERYEERQKTLEQLKRAIEELKDI